ncbi:MAG: 7TM diverse intracellular signaling domain-containing protein [Cytophagales bacterium]|nr:7TM diverse intracellular signaling domain-containing protein [Cytophagales bacterium]
MIKNYYTLLYFIIFSLFATLLHAQHFFSFSKNFIHQGRWGVYEDTTSTLGIDEIRNMDADFKLPHIEKNPFIRNLNYTYWYRFTSDSVTRIGDNYCSSFFRYKKLTLYMVDDSNKVLYQSADVTNDFSTWPILYTKQVLPAPYMPHVKYYVKVVPLNLDPIAFIIYWRDDFYEKAIHEFVFYGIFFGIMFIMFVYNIILLFSSKERLYLYYAGYIFFFAIYAFVEWELLNFFMPYSYESYHFYSIPFALMTTFLLSYYCSFINARKRDIKFFYGFVILIVIRLLICVLTIIFPKEFYYNQYFDIALLVIAWVLGMVLQVKDRYPATVFITYAFGVSVVSYIMASFVPETVISIFDKRFFYAIGLLDIVLFAIALSLRYNYFKTSSEKSTMEVIEQLKINEELKDFVNKELEKKVAERTEVIKQQAEEILQMNDVLKEHNLLLEHKIKEVAESRILQKSIGFDDFVNTYHDEHSCFEYLSKLKWENGFVCVKCKNNTYSDGPILHSRRCNKCKYIETPTSHTIFHHLRFPIQKAFYIMYLTCTGDNSTLDEISQRIDLRVATCHAFKQKVLDAMSKKRKRKTNIEGWSKYIFD